VNNDPGLFTASVAVVVATISVFITSLFTRAKTKSDAHASIANGASTAVDTITEVLDQMRSELQEARAEIYELRTENLQLQKSLAELNIKISELSRGSSR